MAATAPNETYVKHTFCDNLDFTEISTIGDGSCFFHSILRASNRKYIAASRDERVAIADALRSELADSINRIDPKTENIVYSTLSGGTLEDFGKVIPEVAQPNLYKHLKSKEWVGMEVLELVSELLNKDIYIIDKRTKNLYNIGYSNCELLYKKRNSVIIAYDGGHYTALGIANGDTINTHFKPTNPVIAALYTQISIRK